MCQGSWCTLAPLRASGGMSGTTTQRRQPLPQAFPQKISDVKVAPPQHSSDHLARATQVTSAITRMSYDAKTRSQQRLMRIAPK
jgi:hypothetical protein